MIKRILQKLSIDRSDLLAIGLVVFVKGSLVDMNKIPSESMMPLMKVNDRVWVDKRAYSLRLPEVGTFLFKLPPYELHLARWATPQQGDVVTFIEKGSNDLYIKRVIGVAGDKIQQIGNQYYVNGKPLEHSEVTNDDYKAKGFQSLMESHNGANYPVRYSNMLNGYYSGLSVKPDGASKIKEALDKVRYGEWVVPEGKLFVSGDNRDQSYDSRFFSYTFVDVDSVTGKAKKIIGNFEPVTIGGFTVPLIFKGISGFWRDIY